jgi:hypothetical protein
MFLQLHGKIDDWVSLELCYLSWVFTLQNIENTPSIPRYNIYSYWHRKYRMRVEGKLNHV